MPGRPLRLSRVLLLLIILSLSSCATYDYTYREPSYLGDVRPGTVLRNFNLPPALQSRILMIDPEGVSGADVREVLSKAPAPRIINIHGGIYPVHLAMKSFSEFLIGMGYPEAKIRSPRDGSYSYSCYVSSEKLAGYIAWFYEREGMRPMIVGHSQGGIQAVKVLHELAGTFGQEVTVWNPLTETSEGRTTIIDPLSGTVRPVAGLQMSYATAAGSGGFTRLFPNQWSMIGRLRRIPDSVEEFTGFYKNLDLLGGDFLGFGPMNRYEANGTASVRNVRLPTGYNHVTLPVTSHLAESEAMRDWINNYTPADEPELTVEFETPSTNILWAADVWHSIKKHWVLELKRLISAKRELQDAR